MSFVRTGRQVARQVRNVISATKAEARGGLENVRSFSSNSANGAEQAFSSNSVANWAYCAAGSAALLGSGAFFFSPLALPVAKTEAGSVTDGVHPNELPTGTAPEDPVQLPDFTVIDSTGSDFSLDKLQGDFTLLVFGATRDYEDAKSRVQNLSEVIRQTDRRSNMQYMRALFVSEESSEEAHDKMGDLLGKHQKKTERRSHGPRMIGLAGSEVAKLRDMVNAFNDRVAEEGKTEVVQKGDPDGSLFLINPDGQLVAGFKYAAHGADTKEVAEAIATEMKQWTHSHPTWHGPKAVKSRHA